MLLGFSLACEKPRRSGPIGPRLYWVRAAPHARSYRLLLVPEFGRFASPTGTRGRADALSAAFPAVVCDWDDRSYALEGAALLVNATIVGYVRATAPRGSIWLVFHQKQW